MNGKRALLIKLSNFYYHGFEIRYAIKKIVKMDIFFRICDNLYFKKLAKEMIADLPARPSQIGKKQ